MPKTQARIPAPTLRSPCEETILGHARRIPLPHDQPLALLSLLHVHRHLGRVEHLAVGHAELLDLPYAHSAAIAHRRCHGLDGVAFEDGQQMRRSKFETERMRNGGVGMRRDALTCRMLGQISADTAMNHAMALQHISRHGRVHDITLRGVFDDFNVQHIGQAHMAPLPDKECIATLPY